MKGSANERRSNEVVNKSSYKGGAMTKITNVILETLGASL